MTQTRSLHHLFSPTFTTYLAVIAFLTLFSINNSATASEAELIAEATYNPVTQAIINKPSSKIVISQKAVQQANILSEQPTEQLPGQASGQSDNQTHEQAVKQPQEQSQEQRTTQAQSSTERATTVGKHVSSGIDMISMLSSLFIVLVVIVLSAVLLKRFQFSQPKNAELKVISSLSLGPKERIMVVQVGKKQLVLGVTPNSINGISELDEPLESSLNTASTTQSKVHPAFENNPLYSFLKKKNC